MVHTTQGLDRFRPPNSILHELLIYFGGVPTRPYILGGGHGYRSCIEMFLVGYDPRSPTTVTPSTFLQSRLVLYISEYFTIAFWIRYIRCPIPVPK
jgi:hypothetical protein